MSYPWPHFCLFLFSSKNRIKSLDSGRIRTRIVKVKGSTLTTTTTHFSKSLSTVLTRLDVSWLLVTNLLTKVAQIFQTIWPLVSKNFRGYFLCKHQLRQTKNFRIIKNCRCHIFVDLRNNRRLLKMGQPQTLFFDFLSFQTTITIFYIKFM